MASSSPSQGVQIRPSPRVRPCSTPGVPPLPSPAFHQMLGPEDETALPTPVPAASLSGSHSGGWIRPRWLNKALPLSGSPRRASPYLAQPPCQEQAGGRRQRRAGEGEAVNSSPPLAPKPPGPSSPLAKHRQRLSSIPACSPKPGTPPSLLSAAPQIARLGAAALLLHPPSAPLPWGGSEHPWGVRASLRGCSQRRDRARRVSPGQHGARLSVCRALRAAINLERAAAAPAKNHIRCVWQRLDMRETRGLDLEEGGSIPSPPPRLPPPRDPFAGVWPVPGLEHRAPRGMRGWEREVELSPASFCVGVGGNSSVPGF